MSYPEVKPPWLHLSYPAWHLRTFLFPVQQCCTHSSFSSSPASHQLIDFTFKYVMNAVRLFQFRLLLYLWTPINTTILIFTAITITTPINTNTHKCVGFIEHLYQLSPHSLCVPFLSLFAYGPSSLRVYKGRFSSYSVSAPPLCIAVIIIYF